jgi:hypothetical protein
MSQPNPYLFQISGWISKLVAEWMIQQAFVRTAAGRYGYSRTHYYILEKLSCDFIVRTHLLYKILIIVVNF